jgi:CSLREA domain-containing protein
MSDGSSYTGRNRDTFFGNWLSGSSGVTFVVNTLDDSGPGSLRSALSRLGTTAQRDTITFDTSLAGGTIHLTSGELVIDSSVLIVGSGVTIDANADGDFDASTFGGGFDSRRAFHVTTALGVALENLTITGGRTWDSGAGGGAILQDAGWLRISNSTIAGNSTRGSDAPGGAILSLANGTIPNFATLWIENSTIANNTTFGSGSSGGGVAAYAARVTSTTITGNATFGQDAHGAGAAFLQGAIYSSLVLGNAAASSATNQATIIDDLPGATRSLFGTIIKDTAGLRRAGDSLIGDEADPTSVFAQTCSMTVGTKTVQAGVLADNGGLTDTVALRVGPFNPAIDRGDDGRAPAQDQRGFDRLDYYSYWGTADAGSFEVTPREIALALRPAIVVTSTADSGAGSLRAAIDQANAALGRDVILFAPSLAGQTITLTSGALGITDDVSIGGPARFGTLVLSPAGALGVRIDANADGDGNAATSGSGNRRAFEITNGADATLDSLLITGGATSGTFGHGGGVYAGLDTALTIRDSTISGNATSGIAAHGGGIFAAGASLLLVSSVVSGNRVTGISDSWGGGIAASSGLLGVFDSDGRATTMTVPVTSVTILDSEISGNASSGYKARGGGISATTLSLTNSTVSGNSVTDTGNRAEGGGGIAVEAGGTVSIVNATITGNTATSATASGGGVRHAGTDAADLSIVNSIILGNLAPTGSEVSGAFTRTTSLIGGDAGVTAAGVFAQTQTLAAGGRSTQAGLLADNGGPTRTVALKRDAANPALDGATGTPAEPTDQRGQPRLDALPGGGIADIGAFEAQADAINTTDTFGRFEILVTTLSDVVNPFDGQTSLREAIAFANARPGADVIYFAGGQPREIHLGPLGGLLITDDLTISGGPRPDTISFDGPSAYMTVDGNADGDADAATQATGTEAGFSARRVFDVRGGASVTFEKLVITGGRAVVAEGTTPDLAGGGGVLGAAGTQLTFTDSTVTGNSASGPGAKGGGILAYGGGTFLTASAVSLTLRNTTVVDNHVDGAGAAGGGTAGSGGATLSITNSTITGNTATDTAAGVTNPLFGPGGGLSGDGATSLTNSLILGNNAGGIGNDISIPGGTLTRVTSLVGGDPGVTPDLVFAATAPLTVQGQTVRAGLAQGTTPLPTVGLNPLLNNPAIDGGTDSAAPGTDALGQARVDAVTGGRVGDLGAVEGPASSNILVTTLADVVDATDGLTSLREAVALANSVAGAQTIRFADALAGGTTRLGAAGSIAITGDLTIAGGPLGITIDINADGDTNTATQGGGTKRGFTVSGTGTDVLFSTATLTGGRAAADEGGGAVFGGTGTTITFETSTLSGNQAPGTFGLGGAVYSQGAVTLRNSTVANNGAGLAGGGVYAHGITAESATVTANAARFASGLASDAALTLTNSIVLGNPGGSEFYSAGTLTRASSLVAGDAGLLAANVFAATRSITFTAGDGSTVTGTGGVLADNGGPTRTVAPRNDPSNPAIDGASTAAPATDQIGNPRFDYVPGGKVADIGAVEAPEPRSLVVTTLADTVDAFDGQASLREAIAFANAKPGADTVTFAAGLNGAISLGAAGQLLITQDLTIRGDGRIAIDANADGDANAATAATGAEAAFSARRAISVADGQSVTLDGLTITGGRTTGFGEDGGGVRGGFGATLAVVGTTVTGNSTAGGSALGGGIFAPTLTLSNSTVSGNQTSGDNAIGGGLAAYDATLTRSTVSGNSTSGAGAVGGGAWGFTVALTSSTVSGNVTTGASASGGGVFSDGALTATSSTITGNGTAGSGARGGGLYSFSGPTTLTNSIVLGNLSAQTTADEAFALTGGVARSGSLVGGDPGLAAAAVFDATISLTLGGQTVQAGLLADNGGPTRTVALRAAADNRAVDGAVGTTPATDQRGISRTDFVPGGTVADIGAFEAPEPASLIVTTLLDAANPLDGLTSLREAIAYANAKPGADIVTFAAGLTGAIQLGALGQLWITQDLTIRGEGRIVIDANADGDGNAATVARGTEPGFSARRAIDIAGGLDVTLDGMTITGGRTTAFADAGRGGGVRAGPDSELTLIGTTISGNSTAGHFAQGGGVSADALLVTGSVISGNSTAGSGAAGGGAHGTRSITVTGSTISGNSAADSRVVGGGIAGGTGAPVTLTSSTVAGNSTGGSGGGVFGTTVQITSSTITGNVAAGEDGGGGVATRVEATFLNSIVLGNLAVASTNDDVATLAGASLTRSGSLIGGDPGLTAGAVFAQTTTLTVDDQSVQAGVLADNGGPTRTVALLADAANPAIDGAVGTAPGTDQRGQPRQDLLPGPVNADIGAFELQSVPIPFVTTLADLVDATDGVTSLREAIAIANGNPGADVVTFAPGLAGTIHLGSLGQLSITQALTIRGGGRIAIDANADGDADAATLGSFAGARRRAFQVSNNVSATFDGLEITGGQVSGATGVGGGVRALSGSSVTFVDSAVHGNTSTGRGGGVYALGSLTTLRSSFEDNQVTTAAASTAGGGMWVGGDATVTSSTIAGNLVSATREGAVVQGGGAFVSGALTLTGSTVAGNRVTGTYLGGGGGGLYASGRATVTGSTITGNRFGTDGVNEGAGGGVVGLGGVTLTNSLVLGNLLGGDVSGPSAAPATNDIGGALTTDGRSLVGGDATKVFATTAAIGTQIVPGGAVATVRGGVAADNGGPTETVALLVDAANPALDAAGATAAATDQRGLPRQDLLPNVGAADLGAFELQAGSTPPSLVVTTLADVSDAFDGQTSLREAIAYANTKPGADLITFAPGLSGAIHLGPGGQLSITQALTIRGGGAIIVDANADGDDDAATHGGGAAAERRAFAVSGAAASFEGLAITGGRTAGNGGGVLGTGNATLTFMDSTVTGNQAAGDGGGVAATTGARASVTALRSVFEDNTGGGSPATSRGGGIFSTGGVTLTDSTVLGNRLLPGSATEAYGAGVHAVGSITATNTTVAGNQASGAALGGAGGGLFAVGTATLVSSTVTGNLIASTSGANYAYGAGVAARAGISLTNSLVLGNLLGGPVGVAYPNAGANDLDGALTTDGRSIVGGDATKVFATTAVLGTQTLPDGSVLTVTGGVAAENGGPTPTVALRLDPDNPAIDAADPATAPTADQRGVARDAAPDLGAYEAPNPAPVAAADTGSVPRNGTEVGPVPASGTVVISVLANDSDLVGGLVPASVRILGAPGDGRALHVPGEGDWAVNPATGAIAFTPAFLFAGPVTPIRYTVADAFGALSAPETVTVTLTPGVGTTLSGSAASERLDGTAFDDLLSGLGGNDTLDGGLGADSMAGGADNDTFVVDDAGDMVVEQADGGYDRVLASISRTLGVELERLSLTGTADLNGTGNALANRLDGNAGANTLDGRAGNDTLYGGAGADTLLGGAGADVLDGGLGADSMAGGADNDIYVVDDAGDQVVEGAGQGTDRIRTTLLSYSLAGLSEVENLAFIGIGDFAGTGSTASNRITGGAGNDTLIGGAGADVLDGGLGADSMAGGADNDTFVVDDAGDMVVEQADGGYDRVLASISRTLGAELERLSLTGTADLNGTGNALANRLDGNAGANTLDGREGNDTLYGGAGADTLLGGAGADVLDGGADADFLTGGTLNDVFRFVRGQAQGDVVMDFAGNGSAAGDRLEFRGYGTAAQSASLVQIDATTWRVSSADGLTAEVITFANGAVVHSSDWSFL